MKTIIEKSKYLSLLSVLTLLLTFALSLFWGISQAVTVWKEVIQSIGQSPDIILSILKLIDTFLVALILYILGASIFELFISDLDLSSNLVARNLSELKIKLSNLIVLIIAVHAVEIIFDERISSIDKLWQTLAISVLGIVLIAYSYFSALRERNDIHG